MLTQCPECKTTFRLHLNQLQAAAGKVRCSRCHVTFDALDNLVELPPLASAKSGAEQTPPPDAAPRVESTAPALQEPPSPPREELSEQPKPVDEVGAMQSDSATLDEPGGWVAEEDTLSAFIDELKESTARDHEVRLPPVARHPVESSRAETIQLPPVGSATAVEDDLIDTAPEILTPPESVEALADAPVALPEQDTVHKASNEEEGGDTLFELAEPLVMPLAEDEEAEPAIELAEETPETTDTEAEAAPLAGESELDTFFELAEPQLTLLAEDEEAEPAIELAEEPPEAVDAEADAEPLAGENELDTLFQLAEPQVTPLADEEEAEPAIELAEEPPEAIDAEAEAVSLLGEGELDTLFELAEPQVALLADEEEAEPAIELAEETTEAVDAGAKAAPQAGEDELNTLFELAEPQIKLLTEDEDAEDSIEIVEEDSAAGAESLLEEAEFDSLLDLAGAQATALCAIENPEEALIELADDSNEPFKPEAEVEPLFDEAGLDSLFEGANKESIDTAQPQQGDLLALLDEHADEAAIEEQEADEGELSSTPAAAQPAAPSNAPPQSEHRAPSSAEQLGNIPPPSDEQLADEPVTMEEAHHSFAPSPEHEPQGDEPLPQLEEPRSYAIPTELSQAPSRSTASSLLWGVGVLLMCAALALQYIYYQRLQLVENPQLRPLLSAMCERTGCVLPPRRDLSKIDLTERLMQFHPSYEESLLITATLANRADFDQPYPLVEVIMSDIEQRVVAHRVFTARQYLPNYQEGATFPAHSEAPLMLEVLDPGNNAVGFEFRFY